LSKGEQQLYATALLKALVEESNIRFPVFVDSPMQKYDAIHSSKVITEFYPTISDQVVVFPLLHKEMTQAEYNLLLPYVKSVHLIENNGGPGSSFRECKPEELFKESLIEVTHVKQHQNVLTE
jgi:DNA sulfur modification protein DndD